MDQDTINMILQGCLLAKALEKNLSSIINQPSVLSNSCNEIQKIFVDARDIINVGLLKDDSLESRRIVDQMETTLQQSLKSNYREVMNMNQAQGLAQESDFHMYGMLQTGKAASGSQLQEVGSHRMTSNPSKEFLSPNILDPNKGSSSSRKKQRRKEDDVQNIERVPASKMRNTDMEDEDGHTWRKYGRKEILGSKFPRAYYRCTHQMIYQCPAKKQVQRMDEDPNMYEVTYLGGHTCHIPYTTPSTSVTEVTQEISTSMAPKPLSTSLNRLLSINIPLISSGEASNNEGPSTTKNENEFEYQLADMADVLFNADSSTNNMDFIFHSMEEKENLENKKD